MPEDPQEPKDPVEDPKDDPKDPSEEEEFDKDRALATIKKQRESEAAATKRAKELEAKLKEYEDASKSDHEKLEERATGAEQRAAKAEADAARLRVALRKGLSETQAKRLVGESEEDLEKDADELLASFRSEDEEEGKDPPRRPRERLRPGAAPSSEPEENDPKKLAAAVPRF